MSAKRYHVFVFDQYYPRGGSEDYHGSYATLEAAKAAPWQDNEYSFDAVNIAETESDGFLAFRWGWLESRGWGDCVIPDSTAARLKRLRGRE